MKNRIVIIFLFLSFVSYSQNQLTVATWNLMNFGKSKSDSDISDIASIINGVDVVFIQEVSTSKDGSIAVEKLTKIANKSCASCFYKNYISESTNGIGKEKYAVIYKSFVVTIDSLNSGIYKPLDTIIAREPMLTTFVYKNSRIKFLSCHLQTLKDSMSIIESKRLKFVFDSIASPIILGDFNLWQSSSAFDSLKTKLKPSFEFDKTSFKISYIPQNFMNTQYDNIWYDDKKYKLVSKGYLYQVTDANTFNFIRKLSDHAPMLIKILVK